MKKLRTCWKSKIHFLYPKIYPKKTWDLSVVVKLLQCLGWFSVSLFECYCLNEKENESSPDLPAVNFSSSFSFYLCSSANFYTVSCSRILIFSALTSYDCCNLCYNISYLCVWVAFLMFCSIDGLQSCFSNSQQFKGIVYDYSSSTCVENSSSSPLFSGRTVRGIKWRKWLEVEFLHLMVKGMHRNLITKQGFACIR